MPLKRWFAAHHMPTWYSWLVVVGLTVVSNVITLTIVLQISDRALRSERAAREQAAEQAHTAGETNRRAFCLVVQTQEEVFQGSQTPVGLKARDAWHELGEIFRCEK